METNFEVSHFLCSSVNVEDKINIHVALQGVVEYKGFRILAQAKLPVNDESLNWYSYRKTSGSSYQQSRQRLDPSGKTSEWIYISLLICVVTMYYTLARISRYIKRERRITHSILQGYFHPKVRTLFSHAKHSLFLTNESNNKHSKATTHLDTFEFALGECVVNRVTKERYRVVQRVDEENVEVRDFTGETLRVKSSELRSAKNSVAFSFEPFDPSS